MDIDKLILASYTPRGFYIELGEPPFSGPGPDGTLIFPPQSFSVFMHEVAHLVQDRSTFRGAIDFLDHWDRVTAIAGHVRSLNGDLEIPLFNTNTNLSRLGAETHWAAETERIRRLREPRFEWLSKQRAWAYSRHEIYLKTVPLLGRKIDFPVVTIFFVDNVTGNGYEHVLGAWEIKEAYSVAVEMIHGAPSPEYGGVDFEYLVVERILNYFFGEVSPKQIVALCHWCLQDLAPANTFFSYIEHFKDGRLPDPESIYRYARNEALERGFRQNVEDILSKLEEYSRTLAAGESMKLLFDWYYTHSIKLLNLHLDERRLFPLDTFLCDADPYAPAEVQNAGLKIFFQEVEVPLIVWPNGETTSISLDSEVAAAAVFLNQAVFHLSHQLWTATSTSWGCPNFRGCQLPMKEDNECKQSPWKKVRHMPACPYGAAAKLMGIQEGTSIVSSPFKLPQEDWGS